MRHSEIQRLFGLDAPKPRVLGLGSEGGSFIINIITLRRSWYEEKGFADWVVIWPD